MEILFVGSIEVGDVVSGASKVGIEVFNRIKKKYPQTYFINYFQDGNKYNRRQKLFGKKKISDGHSKYGIIPLIVYVLRNRPKIIQIIFPAAYYFPLLVIAKIFRISTLYVVHQNFSYLLKRYHSHTWYERIRILAIERLSVIFSEKLLVLSNFEKKLVKGKKSLSKVEIINNGCNDFDIKKDYSSIKLEELKIISVGNFNRIEKGLSFLLDVLVKSSRSIKFTICSDKAHNYFLKNNYSNIKIVYKLPLNERELRNEFVKNDIFIAFSSYDPFNIALLEAMNSGMLFLATKEIGFTERFNPELSEYLISYGDTESGVKKIEKLLALSNSEKQELSEKIIEFSLNFTWDNVINKYFSIYDKILLRSNHEY